MRNKHHVNNVEDNYTKTLEALEHAQVNLGSVLSTFRELNILGVLDNLQEEESLDEYFDLSMALARATIGLNVFKHRFIERNTN